MAGLVAITVLGALFVVFARWAPLDREAGCGGCSAAEAKEDCTACPVVGRGS